MSTGWEKLFLFWMGEHWLVKTVLGFGWMSTGWEKPFLVLDG
jgi:hypothetical protein